MSQVAASGSQNAKMLRGEGAGVLEVTVTVGMWGRQGAAS
jgi:hypothetical protein